VKCLKRGTRRGERDAGYQGFVGVKIGHCGKVVTSLLSISKKNAAIWGGDFQKGVEQTGNVGGGTW